MDTPSGCSSSEPDDFSTKLIYFSNELPGDDPADLFRRLHRQSKGRKFRNLAIFLEECTAVVQQEIERLPQGLRQHIPPVPSVLTLVDSDEFQHGSLVGAVEGVVLCVLELGMFIGYHEGQDLPYDLQKGTTTLAGLSIGLLAASAVSVSQNLSELASAGAESVRVAFRTGIHVDQVSQNIEPRDPSGNPESWAYVVTELGAEEIQKELDKYNEETGNSALTKVFISASDARSVSISGPPTRVKSAFLHSPVLRYSKHMALPVYGGICHAPHVYTHEDIQKILYGSEPNFKRSSRIRIPLLSPETGEPYPANNAGSLMEQICTEILTGTIYLDNMSGGIVRSIASSGAPECQTLMFRTSIISKGILATMESDLPQVTLAKIDVIDWALADLDPGLAPGPQQDKLAIVGMACRLPGGANDTELFWKLMEEGRDVHTTVPADRFDISTHYDPTGEIPNSTLTPYGNFIDNPGMLDAGFFNMSPREAEQTDPMHRLALVTAYEALEMAGYAPNRTPSTNLKRIATYFGQASDDWREVNAGQNIGTYAVPGGERAFANGRINYFFKFGGPSSNIDTACSSGLAAVNHACSALWAGEADTVLAGGLNVITNPDNYSMLSRGHFLSKTGQCKVWDKDADGYCRADGIGCVIMKRLEDAERDNDNIIATVLGCTTTHSAEAISITHPHAGAQRRNYKQVLHNAGVNPLDISFIELHGTGTQAGDAVESESVVDIFAPLSPRRRPDQYLNLGAVKSNIGHGEAVAGVASLLKALLVYQKSQIPPHVGIKTEMNPTVVKHLAKRNVGLTMENTPWPRINGKKRLAVVNSFGAHGGNTTMILEDAPDKSKAGEDPRKTFPVAVSAKSKNSLRWNIEALLEHLEQNPDTEIGDLSYTTCARRIHHSMRMATAVENIDQLKKFLQSSVEKASDARPIPNTPSAVVFTFSGQGAYYEGIGKQLFNSFPLFQQVVDRLDKISQTFGFPSIIPSIQGESAEENPSTVLTQLTVVITQIALANFWDLLGIKPSAVIGHSLGEFAAFVVAGVISAADAIYMVGKRAELTLESCEPGSHVMLSVRASPEAIKTSLGEDKSYEITCFNGTEDTVLGGPTQNIVAARATLEKSGFKCTQLNVPFAFHTAQMDTILEPFDKITRNVAFKTPKVPIISPLLGCCVYDGKSINAEYLRDATRQAVNFVAALESAQDMGVVDSKTLWVEIGPHPVTATFVGNYISGAKTVPSMRRGEDNFATIGKSMVSLHCEGLPIHWNEYFRPYEKAHELLALPKYRWNEKDYWIPYTGTFTLDKAYDTGKKPRGTDSLLSGRSALKTSSIHEIISEDIGQSTGEMVAIADLMNLDLKAAVLGHFMNGNGVATSSIWGEMSLTIGDYLLKKMKPKAKNLRMNVTKMEVLHAQILQRDTSQPQLLQIEAKIDMDTQETTIEWFNVDNDLVRSEEAFASSVVSYENPDKWREEWDRMTHLVHGRVEALDKLASEGVGSRLSSNMAYTLFKNIVDYTDKYRGMKSVVINDHEAYADIVLDPETHGSWNTPPHWIDSVCHLGGFILNGGDAPNNKDNFFVTPGWNSFRLAEPLQPGGKYRSYVRMFPTGEENMFAGDVYIMQNGRVMGMMGSMTFRQVPRILMNKFFSLPAPGKEANKDNTAPKRTGARPDASKSAASTTAAAKPEPQPKKAEAAAPEPKATESEAPAAEPAKEAPQETGGEAGGTSAMADANPIIADCLRLIARETGLGPEELADQSTFVELGVDSLMSLVLAEKFKNELDLEVKSSLFIECPSIAELKDWLEQYC